MEGITLVQTQFVGFLSDPVLAISRSLKNYSVLKTNIVASVLPMIGNILCCSAFLPGARMQYSPAGKAVQEPAREVAVSSLPTKAAVKLVSEGVERRV